MEVTIAAVEATIPLMKIIPVAGPVLEGMLGVVINVCQTVEGINANREAYEQLAQEVVKHASAVSKAIASDSRFLSSNSGGTFDQQRESIMKTIEELTATFQEVLRAIESRQAEDKKRRGKLLGRLRRLRYAFWHKGDDERKVKDLRGKVESGSKIFQTVAQITLIGAVGRIENQLNTDMIKSMLNPIHDARFDGDDKHISCLPDTRIELLAQIRSWINGESHPSADIFFLTGLAGTGKSTIAKTIAAYYDRIRPTASFFVSRFVDNRRAPDRIIQSIAYQLGVQHAGMRTAIEDSLRNGRDVTTRLLKEQVEGLFIAPLNALEASAPSVVIVIDALDECINVDGREGGSLIPLVTFAIRQLPGRVKLFVTTREEKGIMKMLNELGLNSTESLIRLHNIEATIVEADIRTYYKHHLGALAKRSGLDKDEPWPCQADFDLLVQRTGKLFVYAAMVTRLLDTSRTSPKTKL